MDLRNIVAPPEACVSADRALRLPDRVLQLMQVLWALDHALMIRSRWMEAAIGVTGQQRLVVRLISDFTTVSAGALAATLRLHPSTISGILRRLQAARLIRKKSDPEDRRRVFLELTPLGRTIGERTEGTVEDAIRRALQSISSADVEAAERVLVAITNELQLHVEIQARQQ